MLVKQIFRAEEAWDVRVQDLKVLTPSTPRVYHPSGDPLESIKQHERMPVATEDIFKRSVSCTMHVPIAVVSDSRLGMFAWATTW